MPDIDSTTIKGWLGIDKHGENWRREAILGYRENLLMKMCYGDLTDDEFLAMMEASFEDRRRRSEGEVSDA